MHQQVAGILSVSQVLITTPLRLLNYCTNPTPRILEPSLLYLYCLHALHRLHVSLWTSAQACKALIGKLHHAAIKYKSFRSSVNGFSSLFNTP